MWTTYTFITAFLCLVDITACDTDNQSDNCDNNNIF